MFVFTLYNLHFLSFSSTSYHPRSHKPMHSYSDPYNPSHQSLKLCPNVNGRQNHQLLSTQNVYLTSQNYFRQKGKNPSWWLWLFYRDDKLWCHLLQESFCTTISVITMGHKRSILQKVSKRENKILFFKLIEDRGKTRIPHICPIDFRGKKSNPAFIGYP